MSNIKAINLEKLEEKKKNKMKPSKIKCCYYLPWSRPLNWPSNFIFFFKNIRDRIVRGRYGVAPVDCWAFDIYFYEMLKNGCTIYKEDTIATPIGITEQEWDNILARIIELCDILIMDESPDDQALYEKYCETQTEEDKRAWLDESIKWFEYQQDCRDELMDILKEWIKDIWW